MLTANKRTDFCTACRKDTEYTLKKRNIKKTIKNKEYLFTVTTAVCNECGEEMAIPGLIDKNIREIDEQYRAYEGIVSVDDIEKIMKIYKIGKAPLSLALGFGEVTIARYIAGQIPSKEYSDILRKALVSPAFMKEKLKENRSKIASAAYNKATEAAGCLESLFCVSDKMLQAISYIFSALGEVTPLMLQKLLYFIQGLSCVLNEKPMFRENCRAWVHGPVYPDVYDLFKSFKYSPIEDSRFAILEGKEKELTENERRVIDLAVNTFGEYGAKVLEKITHNELPWKAARKGYGDGIPSDEIITVESIKAYYSEKNDEYDFSSEDGLRRYIRSIIG